MNDFTDLNRREARRRKYAEEAHFNNPARTKTKQDKRKDRQKILNDLLESNYDIIMPINGLFTHTINIVYRNS